MRFSFFSSVVAGLVVTGSVTGGVAAPTGNTVSLPVGSAIDLVNSVNQQVAFAASTINQTLATITSSASSEAKKAVGDKVNQELAALTVALSSAAQQAAKLASNPPASGPTSPGPISDLVSSMGALVTAVANIAGAVLAAINFVETDTALSAMIGATTALVTALISLVGGLLPLFTTLLNTLIPQLVATLASAGGLIQSIGTVVTGIGALL